MVEQQSRNVIIIGGEGCGKSTIAKRLDPRINPNWKYQDRIDRDQICHTEGSSKWKDDYDITVIDTVGFQSSEKFRMENIKRFFTEEEIDHINLIIVVIKEGRITAYEREVLESIVFSLNEDALRKTLAFIFSHCETFTDEIRKTVVGNFKRDKFFSKFANLVSVPEERIITTGFPSVEEWKDEIFKHFEVGIANDDAKLTKLIISATESVGVNSLLKNLEVNHSDQPRAVADSVGVISLFKTSEANNSYQLENGFFNSIFRIKKCLIL